MMSMEFLIPESSAIKLESIGIEEESLVINVTSTHETATCPYCGEESDGVHSWYKRKPADVPSAAYVTRWQMKVRCFFCENEACSHQTFAERFPGIVGPYARRTERLATQQCQVAFEVGGEIGARILHLFSMPVSADMLIRMIRRTPEAKVITPRVLGVDGWAKRKGQSYGTVLVDLEKHQVIDLLDERSAESFSTWLEEHPGVEIISRDRGTEYKKGATDGAPDAIQVADRWHLFTNLKDALESLVTEKPVCLKAAVDLNANATVDTDDAGDSKASTISVVVPGHEADVMFYDEPKPLSQIERKKRSPAIAQTRTL